MKTLTLSQLRSQAPALVEALQEGEFTVITYYSKPLAVFAPLIPERADELAREYRAICSKAQPDRRHLSDPQVEALRIDRAMDNRSLSQLAERYGVDQSYVSLLVRGLRRREAGGPTEG